MHVNGSFAALSQEEAGALALRDTDAVLRGQ
jgi:hypothetical protein